MSLLLFLLHSSLYAQGTAQVPCISSENTGANGASDSRLYTICHKRYVAVGDRDEAAKVVFSYVGVENSGTEDAREEIYIFTHHGGAKVFIHHQCCTSETQRDEAQYITRILPKDAVRSSTRIDVCDEALCKVPGSNPGQVSDEIDDPVHCESEPIRNEEELDKMSRLALEAREDTEEMFFHAYNNYMQHAFPWDELKPLSCAPRKWNRRERGDLDDVLGGFSLTLIDALDTLAVMGNVDEFFKGVELVKQNVHFRRDAVVSVFETTIRVLGGLLSAHLIATGPFSNLGYEYNDELLHLALQLGHRLLPAFDTPTDLPYHRVDLNTGVRPGEVTKTCSAAAGTLLMEFSALSRLTGQTVFERTARAAVDALWKRRSKVTGLLGNTIDVNTGRWLSSNAGTGAGIDSFFEYLLKSHLLLNDQKYGEMFNESMAAIEQHLAFGSWQLDTNMHIASGKPNNFHVSSLQAFWPGLLVLNGDIEAAKEAHAGFFKIWRRFGALPEVFDLATRKSVHHSYPLRPELAESTMMLYAATGDEHYVKVGRRLLRNIQEKTRVSCGFATLADVRSGRLEDRMDSYFLAETLKYLYMLFDLASPEESRTAHSWTTFVNLTEAVFTTEGHLLYKFENFKPSKHAEKPPVKRSPKYPVSEGEEVRPAVAGLAFLQEMVLASLEKRSVPSTAEKEAVPKPKAFVVAPARFGRALSNTATQYLLVYAQPEHACSTVLNLNEIQQAMYAANRMRNPKGLPVKVAVLVDRGHCTFVRKALNVEATGAEIMFVVNGDATEADSVYTMTPSVKPSSLEADKLNRVSSAMVPYLLKLLVYQTPKVFWGGVAGNNSYHYVIEAPVRQAFTASSASVAQTTGTGKDKQAGTLLQMFNKLLEETGLA